MDVSYTKHAEEKIVERKISKEIIEQSLKNPDAVLDGAFGRKIVHKLIRGKLLRIICAHESETCLIITVYYTEPERYEAII